ncbi:MAG: hypothetical protein ABR584_12495 [Candidatus Baltobacteraceae bacterium]
MERRLNFSIRMPFIAGSRNDINDNSLVFMGAEAEQRILSERTDLHVTVLPSSESASA